MIRTTHCIAICAAAATALAQAPQAAQGSDKAIPLSKVERKNKAPVSSDILRVKLPKPVELKLGDGLTVMVLEDHRLPNVTVRLSIQGAGGLYEPADSRGLAGLTAQMLREGIAARSSKQIAEELDRLGASLSVTAPLGSANAVMTVSGLSDNMPQWLALAADVLIRPSFPESELNKLKQREKAQLMQARSSPGFLAREQFNKAVYGEHPAAVTSPAPESLDAITREMLVKWHQEHYVPQNAILGIAGDVRAADLQALLASMPPWEQTSAKVAALPSTKPANGKRIYIVDRPGSVQTNLYAGNIAVSRTDPDYVAMVLMNRIVGAGSASRLFLNLRENKGYTYGAYSSLSALKFAGPWVAFVDMRTDVTEGAATELMKELNRIRDEQVPESELEDAKRSIVASFALSLEQPSQLLDYAITQKEYGLPADYWDTYPTKVMQLTAEQVQRVARKYVDPANIQVVAVGDASKIKAALEKMGPVEVFDALGKPVPKTE
ncbi:MAG TPA: pitrilysin family protein [Bryobacteraceae bacterium]|nr:pitrilysin family protein [Bryobacteraceae bacterium]